MPRFIVAFAYLCLVPSIVAQPANPRVGIRVVEGRLDPTSVLGGELSSTVYVDEVSNERKGQFDRVQQFVSNEQWSEAVDMLSRLSETDQSKLIESKPHTNTLPGQVRYLPVSQAIDHWIAKLAALNPDTLQAYRQRVDPLAKRWWEEAVSLPDSRRLEQLIQEAFHSSYGDNALLKLGDMALERGAFGEARRHYRAIHGIAWWQHRDPRPFWWRVKRGDELSVSTLAEHSALAYVDSEIPLADVWARMVLTTALAGDYSRAQVEFAFLTQAWPNAVGTLGGKRASYAKLLGPLLKEPSSSWSPSATPDWPTFGGRWDRAGKPRVQIDVPMQCAWRFPLVPTDSEPEQSVLRAQLGLPVEAAGELSNQPCSFFPVVFGDRVLIRDQAGFYCLDLRSGKPVWTTKDHGRFFEPPHPPAAVSKGVGGSADSLLGHRRHTVSYASQLITASVHPQKSRSFLIGFSVPRQGAIQFGPIHVENSKWSVHGSPIHDERRCWVGLRLHDTTAQDYVACYDVQTGEQLWRTQLCSAEVLGGDYVDVSCNFLLTKHEESIYVSSHLGTIASLDCMSGKIRWLLKYPRSGPETKNLTDQSWFALRDLTPVMIHDDLLIVAPSDSNRVMALQKDTGELIWATELAADVTQILGVADRAHLIMSGRRLWWFDVYTGQPSQVVPSNPFPSNPTSEPTGVGRGLLSDGKIYWPAVEDGKSSIYVFRQSDGFMSRQPIDLDERNARAGNLIVVPGYLLIAGHDELVVFKM